MPPRQLSWLVLLSFSGCALSHTVEGVAEDESEVVGSFRVVVEETESGAFDVRVVDPAADAGAEEKALPESVLTRVSIVGPGTWDAATRRLSATVRITNLSAPAMDEPFMVVSTVTQASSCVVFEGAHAGGTYVGAQYHFADITAPGLTAVNGASAKQQMRIHAPCAKAFSFTVDVRAVVRGSRRIVPDRDDDGFNIEPGEPAGDDCNDSDGRVYPGGPVPCVCSITCGAGCASGCCDEVCDANCARTCVGGCVCDVAAGPAGEGANPSTLDCQAGSTCGFDCAGTTSGCALTCSNATCTSYCESTAHNRDCTSACANASECVQQCVGADRSCLVSACTGGSDCTLDCADSSHDCRIPGSCDNGSTCEVTCDQTGNDCSIVTCQGGSDCDLSCNGTTGRNCTIGVCDNRADCDVECTGAVRGTCGIGACTGGSTCDVSCGDGAVGSCKMRCEAGSLCTLDCGAYTGSSCALTCAGGSRRRCGTTNTWVCPGTPCP